MNHLNEKVNGTESSPSVSVVKGFTKIFTNFTVNMTFPTTLVH
jgi:hypothetical protein